MEIALRVLVGLGGVVLVALTLLSATRTVVVPRGEQVALTKTIFAILRRLVDVIVRARSGYEWTDRVMSLYAPIGLLSLPLVWMSLIFVAFSGMFWAAGEGSVATSMDVAGSSLLTLGFTKPTTGAGMALSFIGAGLSIAIVVLLLVTYLPTMYSAFSERERLVLLLETRAGAPPTGSEFLSRMGRINGLGQLDGMWEEWEDWFARVQESHTSQPALLHFRSQRMDHSWITTAGALLDAAAIFVSSVDHEAYAGGDHVERFMPGESGNLERVRRPNAEVCIRSGFLCLRQLAALVALPFDPAPRPDHPISVGRDEFDAVLVRLDEAGVPLVRDRDEAWRDFAGWRVNYDEPLLRLAAYVVAPPTPWSSDEPRTAWLRARPASPRRPGSLNRWSDR